MRHLGFVLASFALCACQSSNSTSSSSDYDSGHAASASPAPDEKRTSRTFEFVYTASIDEVPADAKQTRLWIPLPVSTLDQRIEDVKITASHDYTVEPIENGIGKAVCVTSPGKPIQVEARYTVTRYETRGGGKASRDELERDLKADKSIPLRGKVGTVAASLKTSDQPKKAARELYDHTLDHMRYDKPDGGAWGRGDAEWACESGYGNCTDFHSYFMGLSRSKGIPARFEMGFSIPPVGAEKTTPIKGYHCWAFFWDESAGWVPVDISEADKDPKKTDYYFGTLDEHRVTMTGGRDVTLKPSPAKGPLNFFIYPYAEADGVELTKVSRSFQATAK